MTAKKDNNQNGQRYRIEAPPVCPDHEIPMKVGSTREFVRYWYCPVESCNQSCCRTRTPIFS